ncbi:DUF1173 domain-containing protein [Ideonella sp. 4Y16]|uniref:DUF1173 domain-containing protein n=1 Tax=Ideonella alba TaxID=2824118 RepID=A0A940YDJ4_9BURK|nr:DUF1173 domain-containing protein [Ideonella alba]MBQ0933643.1 DUF1173 domain-containing protein [Ideonella alba]MBQ0946231.1 DUF1173 domain-containing protein [Ideonella alba]
MEASASGVSTQGTVYEIDGQRFAVGSPGFAQAIAEAHATHRRPRCLCRPQGVEMYVARLAGLDEGYIVKRMPDTGSHHAPDCPSYEPPAEFSGLGQVLGSAITEDPATGETVLKLDFPLTRMPGRSIMPPAGGASDSVSSSGTKLSLRGLLHYLWDQAELTRWHPGFAGKRSWATVRRKLVQAALHTSTRGHSLGSRLYLPEPFSVDERDAITARRLAQWQQAAANPAQPQNLMLLIGEVKEIMPARYGFKAVVKHMPDQAFAIDEQLYRRLGQRFEPELALWGASDDIHMVMIATFGVSHAGVPAIQELCLMPVTSQWLPFTDGFEKQLLDRLVGENRSFVKCLHYNLGGSDRIASAVLTDCEGSAPMLFIVPAYADESSQGPETGAADDAPIWTWRRSGEPMPTFPQPRTPSFRTVPNRAERTSLTAIAG